MKSKCKFRCDGIVMYEDCNRVVRRWVCDIDNYDEEVGCNKSCHGYIRAKEEDVSK